MIILSVFKVKDGQWGFRHKYRDVTGKRREIKRTKYKSKRDAMLAEAEFMASLKENAIDYSSITLNDLIDLYRKNYKGRVKEQTMIAYMRFERDFISPRFGKCKIKELNRNEVEDWINSVYYKGYNGKKYSESTVKNILKHLQGILSYAQERGYIDKNPIKNIAPPRDLTKVRDNQDANGNYWDLTEFNKFIKFVDDPLYRFIFIFDFYTGLRIGELVALQWKDIDFENKKLTVRQTFSTTTSKIGSTKTDRSYRTIDIPQRVFELLEVQYKYCSAVNCFNKEYYVFGDEKYLSVTTIRNHFNKYVKISGCKKITFHGLRHSHATMLLMNPEIPESLIADRLGHTVNMLRNTYSHIYATARSEMVQYIDQL